MKPIVERTIFLMINAGMIDPRVADEFTSDGELTIEIVTGLQALSRDSDLQKLMQMGEMVRNLPEQAMAMFRWDEYGRALISSLGFNPENWIKNEQEVMDEQRAMQQEQLAMQNQAQSQTMMDQTMAQTMQQAAMQDLEQTGGAGIEEMLMQAQQAGEIA